MTTSNMLAFRACMRHMLARGERRVSVVAGNDRVKWKPRTGGSVATTVEEGALQGNLTPLSNYCMLFPLQDNDVC